jgi:hypothetical protein
LGLVNPDLTGALHGSDLKPAIETILREFNGNLSDDNIIQLNADKITAGSIDASVIDVTNLNADNITAGTLTGRTVQTASSGERILMTLDATYGPVLSGYDSSDVLRTQVANSSIVFFDDSGDRTGYILAADKGAWSQLEVWADTIWFGNSVLLPTATFELNGDANVWGSLYVEGGLDVNGTKNFRIKHPTKENKELVYTCPEMPEVILMCRGTGKVKVPDHFKEMTEKDSLQTITGIEGNWLVTGIRKGYENFNPEQEIKGLSLRRQENRIKVSEIEKNRSENPDVTQDSKSILKPEGKVEF